MGDIRKDKTAALLRRDFLTASMGAIGGLTLATPALGLGRRPDARTLSFYNTHNHEKARITYFSNGKYDRGALEDLDYVLRDWRTDEVLSMDRKTIDIMHGMTEQLRTKKPIHIISGYRSPKTNAMLRRRSSGVAKKSLHMLGKAVDLRIPGHDLKQVYRAALKLKQGGVGIYSRSDFVHVDSGRVRTWGS